MRSKLIRLLSLFSFLVILSFWSATAAAATYYVNVATGNDTNNGINGTSSATPYKFITQAMSVASTGDTILVAPGTYYSLC